MKVFFLFFFRRLISHIVLHFLTPCFCFLFFAMLSFCVLQQQPTTTFRAS